MKAVALTRGGLVGAERLQANDEKSAEAIVGDKPKGRTKYSNPTQEGVSCEEARKWRQLPLDAN